MFHRGHGDIRTEQSESQLVSGAACGEENKYEGMKRVFSSGILLSVEMTGPSFRLFSPAVFLQPSLFGQKVDGK